MNHRWLVLVLGFVVLLARMPAQHVGSSPTTESRVTAHGGTSSPHLFDPHARYRLRAGDTFDVDFALTPEFNQTVAVQPDGYGSFKAVGTLQVQGKTLPELTEAVRTAYAPILHNPQVVIMLKDFEKPYFVAGGQVVHPGKYDLRSDLTLSEALAVAGGLNEKAKLTRVMLYRRTEGGFEGKVFNVKKLMASRDLAEDPIVRPGDLLYVPQSTASHFRAFIPTASMGAYYTPNPF